MAPFVGLLRSRKFWLLVLDTVLSTATYFVTKYAAPDVGKDVLFVIGLYQPIFIAVVHGITTEDAAAKAAGTFRYK